MSKDAEEVRTLAIEVWCSTPSCFPPSNQAHTCSYDGPNGGFETFKWYTSRTSGGQPDFYGLIYHDVYGTNFEFPGSGAIEVTGISFVARGRCRLSVYSKDQNSWSKATSVIFTRSGRNRS
eukprot:scpid111112/ scgid13476/ 